MHAPLLLKRNLEALLRARGQTQHDLAQWCRRTDAWLSKILDINGTRGVPLKHLDRIADFFGIATYQLLQPGITSLLERRKGDRRKGGERRLSHAREVLRDPADDTRELVKLVLSAGVEDRKALYAQLLALRISAPSTAATAGAAVPIGRTHGSSRPPRSPPRP
jgi:hypothetical protein